jgi:hypothetical protein
MLLPVKLPFVNGSRARVEARGFAVDAAGFFAAIGVFAQ